MTAARKSEELGRRRIRVGQGDHLGDSIVQRVEQRGSRSDWSTASRPEGAGRRSRHRDGPPVRDSRRRTLRRCSQRRSNAATTSGPRPYSVVGPGGTRYRLAGRATTGWDGEAQRRRAAPAHEVDDDVGSPALCGDIAREATAGIDRRECRERSSTPDQPEGGGSETHRPARVRRRRDRCTGPPRCPRSRMDAQRDNDTSRVAAHVRYDDGPRRHRAERDRFGWVSERGVMSAPHRERRNQPCRVSQVKSPNTERESGRPDRTIWKLPLPWGETTSSDAPNPFSAPESPDRRPDVRHIATPPNGATPPPTPAWASTVSSARDR